MDMKIQGKLALVCASSRGLGRGCAEALAAEGVNLIINARNDGPLQETAEYIRATHRVDVQAIAADITTQAGQQVVLANAGKVDILVTNAGGPPPGMWNEWQREDFLAALDANMLTPIALIKAQLPYMISNGWGRVVNITSMAVKSPVAVLGLSNSARSGLTGYVAGVARQVAGSGVTINNLLPGLHATERATALDSLKANTDGTDIQTVIQQRCKTIPAGRYGTSAEFGASCVFLCSHHAAYIVGQNILLDGGAVNATL